MEKCENIDNKKQDYVNNPPHYSGEKFQCVDVMENVFGKEALINFCILNSFKYLWRYNKKFNPIEDLKKAQWYLNKAISLYSNPTDSSNGLIQVECIENMPPFVKGGIYTGELLPSGDLVVYIKGETYTVGAQWKYKFNVINHDNTK